ncbi:Protein RTF2 [Dinochytrium kinnereticum]|nr:Protein RTF2 [Dinochytrium kinnereticum]
MGCDGGSIPKRHELVKTKAKPQRPDKNSQVDAKWNCCTLSKEPLQKPVVGCRLGRLYNKDKLIEFLLDRKGFGEGEAVAGHITKASDVITLNLAPNPALLQQDSGQSAILGTISDKTRLAAWICPITCKEMNGKTRSCGCVLSEQAFKEIPSQTCLQCSKPFSPEDLIPINSEIPEEIERLRKAVEIWNSQKAAAELAKKVLKATKKSSKLSDGINGTGAPGEGRKRKLVAGKDSVASKKLAVENGEVSARAAVSNINIPMPNLAVKGNAEMEKSAAIRSLYAKKDPSTVPKGNYLTMGTFTRYAAY